MSIVWLTSFPKSGNTWVRIFLSNYISDRDEPVEINDLERTPIASGRWMIDQATGVASAHLTADETDVLRPDVYRKIAAREEPPFFMKVHDAYTTNLEGQPVFPDDATAGCIYIIRNPLDVTASSRAFWNHPSFDLTVKMMRSSKLTLWTGLRTISRQVRQKLGAWSDHVRSWVDTPKGFSVHTVRYEDLQEQTETSFGDILRFAGLPVEQARLEKAIYFSRFEEIQRQEKEYGFMEKPAKMREPFFRKGKIGSWREELTPQQAARIVDDHQEMMKRFGYLTEDGEIVF